MAEEVKYMVYRDNGEDVTIRLGSDPPEETDEWRRRYRGAMLLAVVGWCILTWIAIVAIWRAL